MTIGYTSADTISIKTKNETILINGEVQIGHYLIPSAGEYDISAIQCEAQNLGQAIVYFIHTEDLTITFLSALQSEVTKLDDASNTDILILEVRSDNTAEDLKPILKALEPAYLFLIGAGVSSEFVESLGLPTQATQNLKVTRSALPLEGTTLIQAN